MLIWKFALSSEKFESCSVTSVTTECNKYTTLAIPFVSRMSNPLYNLHRR